MTAKSRTAGRDFLHGWWARLASKAKPAARRAFVRDYGRAALAKLDKARPGHGRKL